MTTQVAVTVTGAPSTSQVDDWPMPTIWGCLIPATSQNPALSRIDLLTSKPTYTVGRLLRNDISFTNGLKIG